MRFRRCFKEATFSSSVSTPSIISCLVSGASWLSFKEQRFVSVEIAVSSLLVKVVLTTSKLSAAGCCTMQFRPLLHNSLSFVSSTKLFRVVHCQTNLRRRHSQCKHWYTKQWLDCPIRDRCHCAGIVQQCQHWEIKTNRANITKIKLQST